MPPRCPPASKGPGTVQEITVSYSLNFSGVKGGPLYDTTRAWFNLLRFIVGNMKNGYLDEGGFIFADQSSDKSDTEEIDDENAASFHERLVTPEKVWTKAIQLGKKNYTAKIR